MQNLTRRDLVAIGVGALAGLGSGVAQAQDRARTFRGRPEEEWLTLLATRPCVRMVSRHSSTAIVYCLDLGDGILTGFKAERPRQETWWRHEIVSYRFARLLGIEDRTPPCVGRRVPARVFGRYTASDRLVVQSDGNVRGSASVWMPVLVGEQLHTGIARREWEAWMVPGAPIPENRRERARQISVILVFDWLIANYDRWNCCNIPIDERGQIVYRDNDAGWFAAVMNRVHTPDGIRRLPRALWESVQRVDAAAIAAEVARDPTNDQGLFGRPEAAAYERRRAVLLRHIRALIARHGEPAVLSWP